MSRTILSPQRRSEIKKANIGHIIIFCEGKTEKYYFDYFAEIIKKNKYTEIEVVLETANGNAQTVLLSLNDKKRSSFIYSLFRPFVCNFFQEP